MIFIGKDLADPNAHFVTNIVNSIGSGSDLIIDLGEFLCWEQIADRIRAHCAKSQEKFVIYNAYTNESLPLHFKKTFPGLQLVTFFSDDEWRHDNYDRYLALFSDVFTIAVKDNVDRYRSYGLNHVHYMQWACNPDQFHPVGDGSKLYDVTFVGAAYGKRLEYIRHLLAAGIDVKVFGPYWNRHKDIREHWGGFLSNQDMLRVISQSRINLNFLWTSREPDKTTIKGRTLELAACRSMQLSNYTDEFDNYGFVPGKNVAVFEDKDDLVAKVRHYLARPEECERIAEDAYHFVLEHHSWKSEFGKLFERMKRKDLPPPVLPRWRVLVIVPKHVKHGVDPDDKRLDITLVSDSRDIRDIQEYHGVIRLGHDSTINNDTLYMMVFGLCADKANIILANFNLGHGKYWIYFRAMVLQTIPKLVGLLPDDCVMVSGKAWNNRDVIHSADMNSKEVIEYPSFSIKLPYWQSRKLRLVFCNHGSFRVRVRQCVREFRFLAMVSVVVDRLWQKFIVRV